MVISPGILTGNRMQKVKKEDWKTNELPADTASWQQQRSLNTAEYEMVKAGFIPRDMDDRWFIYEEDNWLFFHRSWTGNCIYKAKLEQQGDVYVITTVVANRDKTQCTVTDNETDAENLSLLINQLLLKKK